MLQQNLMVCLKIFCHDSELLSNVLSNGDLLGDFFLDESV